MRLIYLANPYHSDPDTMDQRHKTLLKVLAACANKTENLVFYSPIAHWHETAKAHELPTDFRFWRERDFYMIRKSHSVWVIPFNGWTDSFGVTQEIEFATDIGRPVFYLLDYDPEIVVTEEIPSGHIPLIN